MPQSTPELLPPASLPAVEIGLAVLFRRRRRAAAAAARALPRLGILLLALLSAGALHAQPQGRIEGRVVAVHDGDTVTLLDRRDRQHRVRIAGIDAPETGQPYGRAAKTALSRRVHARWVRVEVVKLDHYGRVVGKVTETGRDVGRDQIAAGMAWWLRFFAAEQTPEDQLAYEEAELRARDARRGLWRDRDPVQPWLWRREHPREAGTPG